MKRIIYIIFYAFGLTLAPIVAIAAHCEKTCTEDSVEHFCTVDCQIDESAHCYCLENGIPICKCLSNNEQEPPQQ